MREEFEEAAHVLDRSAETFLQAEVEGVLEHDGVVSISRQHFLENLLDKLHGELVFGQCEFY